MLLVKAEDLWASVDPLGEALHLLRMSGTLARAWTLASLATEVAMSRSAFAARFTSLVGEPAMHYVARWRMQVALTRLQEEGATIGELASRLGYRSEAADRHAALGEASLLRPVSIDHG